MAYSAELAHRVREKLGALKAKKVTEREMFGGISFMVAGNMGDTATNGVVDHMGEVFGYRNLFIADASIIPEALGVNPSRTIGALAERIAALIAASGR